MYRLSLVLVSGLLLTACQYTQPQAPVNQIAPTLSIYAMMNHSLFNLSDVIDEDAIFELPLAEQTRFLNYYDKYKKFGVREDRIISGYLEDHLKQFRYDGETLSASESFLGQEGNCISLAILTEAYARIANIQTIYTEVSSIPVYEVANGAVLVANHFKTKLLAPAIKEADDFARYNRPGTVIDYFPVYDSVFIGNASGRDLLAKFYSNRSVDTMLASQFDTSYSYLVKALSFAPNDPELLNLAALLHKRIGDTKTARELFQHGFNLKIDSYNLLSNYLTILDHEADSALRATIESRINDVAVTPIDWLLLAKDAIHNGELSRAEALLNKVVDRVPYLPEPYIELAKIAYQRGNTDQSGLLLAKAKQTTRDKAKLALVEAKQAALQRLNINQ